MVRLLVMMLKTRKSLRLFKIVILLLGGIVFIINSCGGGGSGLIDQNIFDSTTSIPDGKGEAKISNTDMSTCGGNLGRKASDASTQEIEINMDSEGVHVIHHSTEHFNCCPAGINVDIQQQANTIMLSETEYFEDPGLACDCHCPRDIETVLSGLTHGKYVVQIYDDNHDVYFGSVAFVVN